MVIFEKYTRLIKNMRSTNVDFNKKLGIKNLYEIFIFITLGNKR